VIRCDADLMLSGLALPPHRRASTRAEAGPGWRAGARRRTCGVIKPSSQGRVVEYRANGKLYMLKVIPRVGKPYFLIDQRATASSCAAGQPRFRHAAALWVVKEF